MCSVVGYIGSSLSREIVIEGLSRLEYRGYDSSGYACIDPMSRTIKYEKSEGKLCQLLARLDINPINGFVGIGHTRWSTHGESTRENAHPHFDCTNSISIVHNGIIENHHELKVLLELEGHIFASETDTEIVAHLFESAQKQHPFDIKTALLAMVSKLEGAFAFIGLLQSNPDTMILVRKRAPLCLGIGKGEMFAASDMLAFAGKTNKVLFLPDESFAIVTKDVIRLYDFNGIELALAIKEMDVSWNLYEKQGHDHYMLKEIYEQKTAIRNTVYALTHDTDLWNRLGITADTAQKLESIHFLGCGTSWHAGSIAQYFFEQICGIPAYVHLASEFRYRPFFPLSQSMLVAISQSGETADTLEGIKMLEGVSMPTIALTNVASSTLVRETSGYMLTHAGREIAVASTKAFSTQITALYWLAHRIAVEKKIIDSHAMQKIEQDLLVAAEILEDCIEDYKLAIIQTHAARYARYEKMMFLGRHISYPFAMEAALKLKEIAYIFATAYPAGELKHGPLALIDDQTPVIIFSHQDPLIYKKLVSNVQEVKARDGHIVSFAFEGQKELISLSDTVFIIPSVTPLLGPLAMTGLMQFFFYAIAKELDRSIDQPRNLAKSVTVE